MLVNRQTVGPVQSPQEYSARRRPREAGDVVQELHHLARSKIL
jgi:hypothetical protein